MMPIVAMNGEIIVVDDEDYEELSKHNWHVKRDVYGCDIMYAWRNVRHNGKRTSIKMHRVILGLPIGDKRIVDHINRDGIDNRRCNLRIATPSQNLANSRVRTKCKSRYKRVYYQDGRKKPWQVYYRVNGKRKTYGYFSTAEEAARASDEIGKKLYGEFARLNFREGDKK